MNCHPTFCGMLVDVSEEGRLLRVRGDQDNPASRGFLCIRGRAAAEIPHNGLRLTQPLARDGWPGLNRLASGEACLGPEASDGLDPRIPGGQSAYDARVEARPIPA